MFCLRFRIKEKESRTEKLAAIKTRRTGVGIAEMRERVRHFKGELDIQSKGTGAHCGHIPVGNRCGVRIRGYTPTIHL